MSVTISLPLRVSIALGTVLSVVAFAQDSPALGVMSALAAMLAWRLGSLSVAAILMAQSARVAMDSQAGVIKAQKALIEDMQKALEAELGLRLAQKAQYEQAFERARSAVGQAEMIRAGRR